MLPYKLWDKAICLCLDKRKEHWQKLKGQLEILGEDMVTYVCGDGSDSELKYDQIDDINPDVSRWIYGVPHLKHHHWNALKAHKGMITMAKQNGWKSILMLEDDSYITSRFMNVLKKLSENPPDDKEWLVAYLGWWMGDENDEFNCNIEKAYNEDGTCGYAQVEGNLGGLHACVIKEEMYDLILSFPFENPIDTQLGQLRHLIPSIMIVPKIIHVQSIYSFTEGAVFNRKVL